MSTNSFATMSARNIIAHIINKSKEWNPDPENQEYFIVPEQVLVPIMHMAKDKHGGVFSLLKRLVSDLLRDGGKRAYVMHIRLLKPGTENLDSHAVADLTHLLDKEFEDYDEQQAMCRALVLSGKPKNLPLVERFYWDHVYELVDWNHSNKPLNPLVFADFLTECHLFNSLETILEEIDLYLPWSLSYTQQGTGEVSTDLEEMAKEIFRNLDERNRRF